MFCKMKNLSKNHTYHVSSNIHKQRSIIEASWPLIFRALMCSNTHHASIDSPRLSLGKLSGNVYDLSASSWLFEFWTKFSSSPHAASDLYHVMLVVGLCPFLNFNKNSITQGLCIAHGGFTSGQAYGKVNVPSLRL